MLIRLTTDGLVQSKLRPGAVMPKHSLKHLCKVVPCATISKLVRVIHAIVALNTTILGQSSYITHKMELLL